MDQPRVKNPTLMLILYGTVIAVVIYWFYQVVCNYLAGGPDAPNLATVIVGGVVMLGGSVFVGSTAVRIYLQEKRRAREEAQSPEEPPEEET